MPSAWLSALYNVVCAVMRVHFSSPWKIKGLKQLQKAMGSAMHFVNDCLLQLSPDEGRA